MTGFYRHENIHQPGQKIKYKDLANRIGVSKALTYHITIVRDHIVKGMSRLVVGTKEPFSDDYSF